MDKFLKFFVMAIMTICLLFSVKLLINAESADASYVLREGLKNREKSITVTCEPTEDIDNIIDEALKHTGVSTEGDYIKYHLMSDLTYKAANGTDSIIEYRISPRYLSTFEQEQELTNKLNEFYNSLKLDEMSSYDKLKSIYDYICDNVAYGYQNNSAYSALINGSSSCRGYALLFYRMALDLGFDARIIPGRVTGGNYDNYHEWNIVRIGDKYYNVDVNFGDNTGSQMGESAKYTYFLKGTNGIFKDGYGSYVPAHVRDAAYDTEEFNINYPMSSTDFNKNNYVEEPEQKPELEEKPEENATTENTEETTETTESTEETTEENTEESTEDNNHETDKPAQDTTDYLSILNKFLDKIIKKPTIIKVKLIRFFKIK